ncbi:hypothetical protein NXY49_16890 [Bacteroides fragilis]|nr:hypothetical protein [Bacteroides fragilis]
MDKSKVNFSKPMLIQSVAFKDVFLRMDGKGISTTCGAGAGKVNCQRSMAPTGAFKVQKQTDGTFTIESSKYPGVFLRMDGNGIHAFAGSGSGRVNCQFGASALGNVSSYTNKVMVHIQSNQQLFRMYFSAWTEIIHPVKKKISERLTANMEQEPTKSFICKICLK